MKNYIYKININRTNLKVFLCLAFVLIFFQSFSFSEPEKLSITRSNEKNVPSGVLELERITNFWTNLYNKGKKYLSPERTEATVVSGSTAGDLFINSGSAGYNIPITVTPGTAGMQPDLSVNYSSSSVNAYLGSGFSLAGVSVISRGGANKSNNGIIDGADFDANDKFYLEGQLLVCINGTYGANGAEYRTENDVFTKVISYGKAGNFGPQKFKAWTKSGLIYEYAYTANSRIEAQGRAEVVYWAVNKVSDTKNNYMNFQYYENNPSGEYYVTRIDYTGNTSAGLSPYASVRFIYQGRSDPMVNYSAGSKISVLKRLQNIKVYYGSTEVRSYNLTYQNLGFRKISQLKSIQEFGTNGQCFKPTNFTWQTLSAGSYAALQYNAPAATGNYNGIGWHGPISADADGDGHSDVIWAYNGKVGLRVAVSLSNGNGTFGAIKYSAPMAAGNYGVTGWRPASVCDANGDGKADIFWTYNGKVGVRVAVSLSNGNGTYSAMKLSAPNTTGNYGAIGWQPGFAGDANGDGLTDIFWTYNGQSGTRVHVSLATGNGIYGSLRGNAPNTTGNYGATGWNSAFGGDANGDGLTDIFWTYNGKSGTRIHVSLSNGNGTYSGLKGSAPNTTGNYGATGWQSAMGGDANGDGLTDIFWTYNGKSGVRVHVSLAKGNGLYLNLIGNAPHKTGNYGGFGWHSAIGGDANGDGLTDLFWTYNGKNGTRVHVSLATGNGLYRNLAGHAPNTTGNYGAYGWTSAFTGDVNGDGNTDILWSYAASTANNGTRIASSRAIAGGYNISKIVDGYGKQMHVTYKLLTDNSVYTKGSGSLYPNVNIQPASYAVSSYQISNGIGGLNKVSFKYGNLITNLSGRGSNGFQWIEETDVTTGIKTKTWYSQDYHYKGMIVNTEERLSNGTLVSKTVQTPARKSFSNGVNERWFVYTSSLTDYNYEINGALINSVTKTYQYNDFSEVTYSKLTYSDGLHKTETWNSYSDNIPAWQLARLSHVKVQKTAANTSDIIKEVTFAYEYPSGILRQEKINYADGNLFLTKNYTLDAFGNVTKTEITGKSGLGSLETETRTSSTVFDSNGRFAVLERNQIGHAQTIIYDQNTGNIISQTDPNGLSSTYQYDGFGRIIKETRADGNITTTSYGFSSGGNAPVHAVYYVKSQLTGSPDAIAYFDCLNREIRTEKTGFNGKKVFIDTQYNTKGEVSKSSAPYYKGSAIQWATNSYDALSRLTAVNSPITGNKTMTYNGLITTVTNELGQKKITHKNSLGQKTKVIDNLGNAVSYKYDANGNVVNLIDPNGNVIAIEHDLNGNKTSIDDPDVGEVRSLYNAFGELRTSYATAAGRGFNEFEYDKLGRIVKKTEDEKNTTYTYDQGNKALGKISVISRDDGYKETYTYDNYSRLIRVSYELPGGGNYAIHKSYDGFGRESTLTYPSGLKVQNVYNAYNYLHEVKNVSSGKVYFTANSANALNQMTSFTLGNGLQTKRSYDAIGRLTTIQTGNKSIQDLKYEYNKISNLTARIDNRRSRREGMTFDVLDRLQNYTVKDFSDNVLESVQMTYDALGNITYKSDVGCYKYDQTGNAGPHAVTSIDGLGDYTYDAFGNVTSAPDYSVTYTSFDKASTIVKGNKEIRFDYGSSHKKYHKSVFSDGVLSSEIYYVGTLYEKEQSLVGIIEKNYIFAGNSLVAVFTNSNNPAYASETVYLHKDHLGSITEVTKEDGTIKESFSYDVWGKRRNPVNWTSGGSFDLMPFYNNGFTGHKHIDEIGIIDMGGRVFDPTIARFLSADPYIQSPDNSQSLNRYSYVMNDPLTNTDPSGFWGFKSITKAFKKAFKAVKNVAKSIVKAHVSVYKAVINTGKTLLQNQYVAMAVQVAAAYYGGPWGAAAASALITKANGGTWSDAIKSGAITGLTAYGGQVIGGRTGWGKLGGVSDNVATKAVANGVFHGAMAEAQGGKFQAGFLSGLASSAGGEFTKEMGGWNAVGANMIIGGTASKLGGGKFSNGAMSGAMIMIFDHLSGPKLSEQEMQQKRMDQQREYIRENENLFLEAEWDLISSGEDAFDVALQLYTHPADGPSAGFLTMFMNDANVYAALIHDYRYGSLSSTVGFKQSNADLYTDSKMYANRHGYSAAASIEASFWGKIMQIGTDIGGRSAWKSERQVMSDMHPDY